ncbi:hypothetical protein AAFF_G00105110 [Aldrovandia affinis]|uniref:Uncharacterized protein n=1 Tax=Aldrovandia affinis TaxID=143900 RepID=A0AAD7T1Y6_9TELE|nr:hypothetical protein AAFF_G00105110 [Aldrovandia affinis]
MSGPLSSGRQSQNSSAHRKRSRHASSLPARTCSGAERDPGKVRGKTGGLRSPGSREGQISARVQRRRPGLAGHGVADIYRWGHRHTGTWINVSQIKNVQKKKALSKADLRVLLRLLASIIQPKKSTNAQETVETGPTHPVHQIITDEYGSALAPVTKQVKQQIKATGRVLKSSDRA